MKEFKKLEKLVAKAKTINYQEYVSGKVDEQTYNKRNAELQEIVKNYFFKLMAWSIE